MGGGGIDAVDDGSAKVVEALDKFCSLVQENVVAADMNSAGGNVFNASSSHSLPTRAGCAPDDWHRLR